MRNRVHKSRTRTEVKKALEVIQDADDLDAAVEQTRLAVSQLDKAASRGIMHRNTAARKKSRLMKKLAKLESGTA